MSFLDNAVGFMTDPFGAGSSFTNGPLADSPLGSVLGLSQNKEAKRQFNTSLDWQKYQFNKQIEMSNTAHQREIADLEKSGLNPVLSVNGQGLSTPSGVGSPSPTASMNNGSQALNFIVGLLGGLAQTKVASATVKSAEAQAFEHNALGLKHIADTDLSKIQKQLAELDFANYDKKLNATLSKTPEGFIDMLGRFYNKTTSSPTAKKAEVVGNKVYDIATDLNELGSKLRTTFTNSKGSIGNRLSRTHIGQTIGLIRKLQKYALDIFK